jgi:peptidoglycan/xylan/chitin deacetylase (PgdA/CDA1 family)
MNRALRAAALLVPLAMLAACATVDEAQMHRHIALTFDDVTLGDGPLLSGTERTARLITELEAAGVEEAMFFITTGNVAAEGAAGMERVNQYAAAGHTLANHSHAHAGLSGVETADFIADLDRAAAVLTGLDNVEPWFRYPYLDEGSGPAQRDALREALAARGLGNGYVTINTFDWALVNLTADAMLAGIDVDIDRLRDLYVDVILESTVFYDDLGRETLGRSPLHVLLLHENDLAALFVGDLVAELRTRGYEIVPATQAFTDPIAAREPDTMWLGQGRIAALARERGASAGRLEPPAEDLGYLERRFNEEVLLEAAQP